MPIMLFPRCSSRRLSLLDAGAGPGLSVMILSPVTAVTSHVTPVLVTRCYCAGVSVMTHSQQSQDIDINIKTSRVI